MNEETTKRIQMMLAVFGCVLVAHGVNQLTLALGISDLWLGVGTGLIMVAGGLFALLLMVKSLDL